MPTEKLLATLDTLIEQWEQETIEFKQADNNYSTNDIGKYFSALSNEANLNELDKAWLVFGVNNKTRNVVGSNYREDGARLQSIKQQISENTNPSVSFRGVYELVTDRGRIVMFEIPAAPRGIPIAWKGHYYARNGESLASLGLTKQDEIRAQTQQIDWSSQIVAEASLTDLDPAALAKARESYAIKYANRHLRGLRSGRQGNSLAQPNAGDRARPSSTTDLAGGARHPVRRSSHGAGDREAIGRRHPRRSLRR